MKGLTVYTIKINGNRNDEHGNDKHENDDHKEQ